MAYGTKYRIQFINEQNDEYRIDILEKDFVGNITTLLGASNPFVQKYSIDERPPVSIIASEAEVNFWSTDQTDLTAFYSEDDEQFRIDFYCDKLNGVTITKLLWSGYIVQDDCREDFQDTSFVVTLTATDNLALLKDISYSAAFDTANIEGLSLVSKTLLFDIIKISILNTGISLPLRIFANIYENTQDDRGDVTIAEFFSQTRIFTGSFLSDDSTWDDCYTMLEKLLTPLNATIIQADGYWNIIRYPEARLFIDNAITGTQYNESFATPTPVTLDPNLLIETPEAAIFKEHELINADAIRRIVRPFKFCKYTFNYEQPKSLIIGSDLQTLGDFIGTSTDGDLRYDDYELPASWLHKYDDESFIRVVTDTVTNTEVERYVYQPKIGNDFKYVRFNPIEVSAGDVVDFSVEYRHFTATTDNDRFTTRFILVTAADQYYVLTKFPGVGSSVNVHWTGPFSVSVVDTATTVPMEYPGTSDDSQFQTFSLSQFVEDGGVLPRLPSDGMLLIDIAGSNETNLSFPDIDVIWKSITLTIINRINDSTDIIGQTHDTSQEQNIKNVFDEEIKTDDSPRNTIAGTLFTNDITTFGADIGDIYFTRTDKWHLLQNDEELRLGELTTYERKFMSFKPRTIIEGTFTRVRYERNDVAKFVSPLTFIQFEPLPALNFILGSCEINYMENIVSGTMWELFSDDDSDDDLESTYEFNYLYRQS